MPVVEVAGNYSGFGDQISSRRETEPKHVIGSGKRTLRILEKTMEPQIRGLCAPGANCDQPVRRSASANSLNIMLNYIFSSPVESPAACASRVVVYTAAFELLAIWMPCDCDCRHHNCFQVTSTTSHLRGTTLQPRFLNVEPLVNHTTTPHSRNCCAEQPRSPDSQP
jgi:hypothetical protein